MTLNGKAGDPFTCAHCKGEFERTGDDAEAVAESDAMWGPSEDLVIICDECFNQLMGNVSAAITSQPAES